MIISFFGFISQAKKNKTKNFPIVYFFSCYQPTKKKIKLIRTPHTHTRKQARGKLIN